LNKVKFSAVILAAFLLFGINKSYSQTAPPVSVSANKKSYSPGESGVLIFNFKTTSKVKIPKEPGVTINLSSGEIEGHGTQDYSGGEGDYISNSKVKYNFTVPPGAASGSTLIISGTVKYAYCSTLDGVCKLANKDFTAKVKVK
jgi:hypothetical protein